MPVIPLEDFFGLRYQLQRIKGQQLRGNATSYTTSSLSKTLRLGKQTLNRFSSFCSLFAISDKNKFSLLSLGNRDKNAGNTVC